jgi:hypothetical protein
VNLEDPTSSAFSAKPSQLMASLEPLQEISPVKSRSPKLDQTAESSRKSLLEESSPKPDTAAKSLSKLLPTQSSPKPDKMVNNSFKLFTVKTKSTLSPKKRKTSQEKQDIKIPEALTMISNESANDLDQLSDIFPLDLDTPSTSSNNPETYTTETASQHETKEPKFEPWSKAVTSSENASPTKHASKQVTVIPVKEYASDLSSVQEQSPQTSPQKDIAKISLQQHQKSISTENPSTSSFTHISKTSSVEGKGKFSLKGKVATTSKISFFFR